MIGRRFEFCPGLSDETYFRSAVNLPPHYPIDIMIQSEFIKQFNSGRRNFRMDIVTKVSNALKSIFLESAEEPNGDSAIRFLTPGMSRMALNPL